MKCTINLLELIEKSKNSKAAEFILDKAVKDVFGDRKPLTEILNKLKNHKA